MEVSFAILTWNSEKYLERCLDSIEGALRSSGLSYEILVLDNGSQDRTRQLLEDLRDRYQDRLRVFYEKENTGTTRSRNRLFSVAQGNYLCVMDSDVELRAGAVDKLLCLLKQDRSLGIVVPRIHYPSGAWQKSFDRFPTVGDKVNRFFRLREIEKQEALDIGSRTRPFYVDYAISAFWLMPRGLLDVVGPLDERIFYAPEDVDFCLRVWKAGYRVVYEPSVVVVHHTQEISRGATINMAKLSHIKGLAYYFLKHRYCLRRPTFHDWHLVESQVIEDCGLDP